MFSIRNDEPFLIFQQLKAIALDHCAHADIIDLSRGDPGFCFTPSVRGREFSGFILWLDSKLNVSPEKKFLLRTEKDAAQIMEEIATITHATYQDTIAKKLIADLHFFIGFVRQAALDEGKEWTEFRVLRGLFDSCAMSGGSYLRPSGEEITRLIVAAAHRRELHMRVHSNDLILTSGVSHAIGTLCKMLGSEGCGFLREGDSVAISSPVYAPYNSILLERGLTPVPFAIDPVNGKIEDAEFAKLRASDAKALILIDPNNPTGFALGGAELEKFATLAKEKDMLIISDEVYFSFFPEKKSILALCPERTIHLNARSKIERSTGLRFGEIVMLPEARTTVVRLTKLSGEEELMERILFAKAPGRTGGQFQHTTFVPGPSQLLGIAHLVFGGEERQAYIENLRENRTIFCSALDLPHEGNLYYVLFDIDAIKGCTTQNQTMEERLINLAEAGVIYLPAYKFFAPDDRDKPGRLTAVRASIVNTTPERLKEAAEITKRVLCD